MKLTIGMIVKNEEKWLDKCLTAIKPILDNVDCELIITDTGSTDKTVEIAKKYTDKVLYFEWIKDFAAARNFGLEKAKGEWFMMLDADDIFRTCDDIIKFFNSGEYKKYNAGSYVSRNFFNTAEGTMGYSDFDAPRLIKLKPTTRYVGIVHEALTGYDAPFRNLTDIADHYGYVYKNDEEKMKKFERNSELLLKRFETESETNPMLHMQLYEAYLGIGMHEKAFEYLESGIALSKKMNSITLATFYTSKANVMRSYNRNDVTLETCDEYFKMNKLIRPHPLSSDAEIYALRGETLYTLGRYGECIESFRKFLEVYKDIESGKLHTYDAYLTSLNMCTDVNILPLFNEMIHSCIIEQKFNLAESYLTSYPIYKYCIEPSKVSELVKYELEVAAHFSYKGISKYSSRLDESGKKMLISGLCIKLYTEEDIAPVISALGELAKDDEPTKARLAVYEAYIAGNLTPEALYEFTSKYTVNDACDMIYLAMASGFDITPVFSSPDFDMKLCAYLCCKNIPGALEATASYSADLVKDTDSLDAAAEYIEYCAGTAILDDEGKQHIEELLSAYSAIGERYAREKGITDAGELPERMRAAVKIGEVIALHRGKRLSDCISRIKETISVHEGIAAAVSEYGKQLIEEYKTAQAPAMSPEMQKLADMLKNNVRVLIGKGDMASAAKILAEYEKISPSDPEIMELKTQIG